ncbi:hypothetical protein FIM12_07890 [SAR202 cluster bacterium AD-804-J14_MRT_500m]|nr:hypothetical protein [SAR202 cluster bacterium AD-804-J14_MRT_500m]
MVKVNSVLGAIDPNELGFTLTHEHISGSSAGFQVTYPEIVNADKVESLAIKDLKRAHQQGVTTIVDCSTYDIGRDVRLIEAVSRGSGVQIICATGSHLYVPRTFFESMFPWLAPMPADDIANLWVREIEEGIEGTSVKAGIIKVATSDPIRPSEELMLRAAARTHLRTGVPITTHTPMLSLVGEAQIRVLEEEGVDLTNVYIGHVNSTLDKDYHLRLIDKGVWLGMDHFFPSGPPGTPDWEERSDFIKDLIDSGHQDRIMMSHDWNFGLQTGHCLNAASPSRDEHPDAFLWISKSVLPRLRELGASESSITSLMVDNPRRFFGGK